MVWIDFREIKARVGIDQVVDYYGISLAQKTPTQKAGPCPFPKHGGDRSNNNAFHTDSKKNAFNCFSHCGGGNAIDFVAKMEQCSFDLAQV